MFSAILSDDVVFYSEMPKSDEAIRIGNQVLELAEAKERWSNSGVGRDHSFEYQRHCFCKDSSSVHRVIVSNGRVESVEVVSQYRHIETDRLETYPTIAQLFGQVADRIIQSADPNTKLVVQYHEDLGYPTKIMWRNAGVRDGDWTAIVTNMENR